MNIEIIDHKIVLWKSFDLFPSYDSLKETSAHFYKNRLKIIIADESKELYLLDFSIIENSSVKFKISHYFISETYDFVNYEFNNGDNDTLRTSILKSIDEYLSLYREDLEEPHVKYKWCYLSEFWKFLENSIT